MTSRDYDHADDSAASYTAAITAERMLRVVAGEVVPRLEEPVDLVLLAAMGRRGDALAGGAGVPNDCGPGLRHRRDSRFTRRDGEAGR